MRNKHFLVQLVVKLDNYRNRRLSAYYDRKLNRANTPETVLRVNEWYNRKEEQNKRRFGRDIRLIQRINSVLHCY